MWVCLQSCYVCVSSQLVEQTTEWSDLSFGVECRKVGINAAAYVQFFNFLVRRLFEGSLYAMFWVCKTWKAAWHDVTCTVKVKLDFVNVTKWFQNVNKQLGMQRAVEFTLHGWFWAAIFKPRPLCECGFYAWLYGFQYTSVPVQR